MNALYKIRYVGEVGAGAGVLYIGNGIVLGIDVLENVLRGTYNENSGRINAEVTLTAGSGGTTLVTGHALSPGQSVPIGADLPVEPHGAAHQIWVGPNPVQVAFEKIGDIPD